MKIKNTIYYINLAIRPGKWSTHTKWKSVRGGSVRTIYKRVLSRKKKPTVFVRVEKQFFGLGGKVL